MLLRALQCNISKRSVRYVLIIFIVIALLSMVDKEKAQTRRLARVDTARSSNSIDLEIIDSSLDFSEDYEGISHSNPTQPVLHLHDQVHGAGAHKHGHKLGTHYFREDGLVEVNPLGQHPIYDLMQIAERRWKEKLARQSTTLGEAVMEYKRRYQRDPPLGFKDWWNYVKKHNVQLPDEYNRIYRDLEPFWGISPSRLRILQSEYESEPGTYTLSNGNKGFERIQLAGSVSSSEEKILEERSQQQLDVLQPISQWLPPFRATFTYHDSPNIFVGHDLHSEAVAAAAVQEYINILASWDDYPLGWASVCPVSSPIRRNPNASSVPNLTELHMQRPKTFIHNHVQSMNPCTHYNHVHLNGQLLNFGLGPRPRQRLHPSFSMSTTALHSDILVVAPENWVDDVGDDPEWEQKPHSSLLWRGSTTGMLHKYSSDWKYSQRLRMIALANQKNGNYDVLRSVGPNWPIGAPTTRDAKELNQRLMDMAFVGNTHQCDPIVCKMIERSYNFTSDYQKWSEANMYKYMIDTDGNGWSSRFKRLISTNSVVLKATICPEWFSERIMPWVHYVPVKMDFTDLYDIMAFFHDDSPNQPSNNDHLAKKIAYAGKEWSQTFWRKEDQTAYMFRLMLEWARIQSPDRDSMSFLYPNLDDPEFM